MDKIKNYLLIIFTSILISSCATIPWATEADINKAFYTNDNNDFIHRASSAVFPKEFTNFFRNEQRIYIYDVNALDVSIEYTFKHGGGIATIYVYPAPENINKDILLTEYERCKQEVFMFKNVINLLKEQTVEYNSNDTLLPAYFAAFHIFEGDNLYSLVTLTGKDSWFVLFRVSFPIEGSNESIRDMMSKLPREFDFSSIE